MVQFWGILISLLTYSSMFISQFFSQIGYHKVLTNGNNKHPPKGEEDSGPS